VHSYMPLPNPAEASRRWAREGAHTYFPRSNPSEERLRHETLADAAIHSSADLSGQFEASRIPYRRPAVP